MSAYETKRYSFRFSNITAKQAVDLSKKSKDVKICAGWRKRTINGIVSLRKSPSYKWINSFIQKNGISKSKCDIFVSIATGYDTRMLAVPKHVLKVIHDTKVDITFSFTSLPA